MAINTGAFWPDRKIDYSKKYPDDLSKAYPDEISNPCNEIDLSGISRPTEYLPPMGPKGPDVALSKTTENKKQTMAETNNVASTLVERGTRYGKFTGHAKVTQSLKTVMNTHENWANLADDQKEALEMIAHKIGRILNGDPNYADSWHDIAGYSKLVDDRLTSEKEF